MRIGSHHHVWDLQARSQPWTNDLPALQRSFGIDELRPSLARHDIGGTIAVQTVAVADETPELLALAAADPDIAGVAGWTDLTALDVADRLAELIAPELVGIRHLVQGGARLATGVRTPEDHVARPGFESLGADRGRAVSRPWPPLQGCPQQTWRSCCDARQHRRPEMFTALCTSSRSRL
jgi:L-fuconolactonase